MKRRFILSVFLVALTGCYGTPRQSFPDATGTAGTTGSGGSGGAAGTGGMAGTAIGGGAGGAAPYCGDRFVNGSETCDNGRSGSTDLGACNPECTGYYEKKFGRLTGNSYATDLGGIAGADSKCRTEFGSSWKALLVGGTRRATVTPFAGDGQQDWVIKKYTHYYNTDNQLVWRTDDIALLGVRNGARTNLYAPFFVDAGSYPWAGWASDWTTVLEAGSNGTCNGWTSDSSGWGSIVTSDLATVASEQCGSLGPLLCVQQ